MFKSKVMTFSYQIGFFCGRHYNYPLNYSMYQLATTSTNHPSMKGLQQLLIITHMSKVDLDMLHLHWTWQLCNLCGQSLTRLGSKEMCKEQAHRHGYRKSGFGRMCLPWWDSITISTAWILSSLIFYSTRGKSQLVSVGGLCK